MSQASSDKSREVDKPSEDNRRGTERVPAQFSLMYSGMSDGRMLIGNGVVSNVSKTGIGILGDHLVTHGMDLSLFINLPGIEEPMCIAESRVTWVSGRPHQARTCSTVTNASPRSSRAIGSEPSSAPSERWT